MSDDVKIPKIFVQEWMAFPDAKGKYKTKDIPEHWKSSPASIRKYMPDWKYVLIDNKIADKLVKDHFPDFWDTYNSLEYPIMRVDAVRYMFLYIYGGVYMDLDIELMKPLDDLFREDADIYVVKSGNIGSVYTNSFLASKPGCKIWLECLKEIKKPYKYWMIGKHFKVMGKTGPLMLTRVLNKKNIKNKYKIATIPKKLVMPCNACDEKPCTKLGAYTKALEGSSWCGWDSLLYNGCLCHWEKILLVVLFIIVFLIIIYVYN